MKRKYIAPSIAVRRIAVSNLLQSLSIIEGKKDDGKSPVLGKRPSHIWDTEDSER